jgi:hypothetical protein
MAAWVLNRALCGAPQGATQVRGVIEGAQRLEVRGVASALRHGERDERRGRRAE